MNTLLTAIFKGCLYNIPTEAKITRKNIIVQYINQLWTRYWENH